MIKLTTLSSSNRTIWVNPNDVSLVSPRDNGEMKWAVVSLANLSEISVHETAEEIVSRIMRYRIAMAMLPDGELRGQARAELSELCGLGGTL